MTRHISGLNQKRWSGRLAGYSYRNADALFVPEITIIDWLRPRIPARARILDIGVGTGRTTQALRTLSPDYIGVDYSPPMVRGARARFPEAEYRCMDARDLGAFGDGTFDLVWFSFNGIDYASPGDRLTILREIHRVTGPGGMFCLSSHNRDFEHLARERRVKGIEATRNPVKLAYRTALYLRSLWGAWRLRGREVHAPEYALLNDSALYHSLLTYYISLPAQVAQLEGAGFGDVRAFGIDGEALDTRASHSGGYMIHYLCRKTPLGR